jgi:hypothetical protein
METTTRSGSHQGLEMQIQGITMPSNILSSYLMGFGLESDKELYVLTTENPGPSGSTGKVWKILPG